MSSKVRARKVKGGAAPAPVSPPVREVVEKLVESPEKPEIVESKTKIVASSPAGEREKEVKITGIETERGEIAVFVEKEGKKKVKRRK